MRTTWLRPAQLFLGISTLTLFLAATPAPAQEAEPASELVGLWGAERDFGPEIQGLLNLDRVGEGLVASIAGVSAAVQVDDQDVSFELPGDRGAFRGSLQADRTFLGHWIQPVSKVYGVRFASPVLLRRTSTASWRGEVLPLDDRLTLYLVLEARPDGTVGAFLRNPERNLGMSYRFGDVTREDDQVLFHGRDGDGVVLRGEMREDPETLSIFFPAYGATFDFTRRGRDQALGFYPRSADESTYTYHRPTSQKDGWVTGALDEVGIDEEPIQRLVQSILDTSIDSVTAPYLQGLLITRRGKLVLEEYFYGFHPSRPHDTRSAGKSLTSTLIGLAIDRGARFNVESSVYELLEDPGALADLELAKKAMTVGHLLTMSSGYACDDNDPASPGNEDRMQSQEEQPDWIRYALDLPMARQPGEQAVYCSAGINLLGGVLSKTSEVWLPDLFLSQFAQPLQIWQYHLNLTPTGETYMGGGIRLLPRDLLKLGQLHVSGGRWLGRPAVSEQWVERATRPHAGINEPDDYGYGWWIKTYRHAGRDLKAFYASGNGGQLLIVFPDLDLVVLFLGGNYGNYPTWSKFRDELVPELILPAVREGE